MTERRTVAQDAMHAATRDTYDLTDDADARALSDRLARDSDPLRQVREIREKVASELVRKGFPDPSAIGADGIQGYLQILRSTDRLSFACLLAEVFEDTLSAERELNSADVARAFLAGQRLARSVATYQTRAAHHEKIAKAARFTAQNKGRQAKTLARAAFLEELADHFQTTKRDALAAYAVQEHPAKVLELWPEAGGAAMEQIVNFLRNHPLR